MSLFFYLFTFVINLWLQNSLQQTSLQCFSIINMVFSDQDKILIKRLYLKRYTAKRLTDEFPEKSWTKRGVNNLLKKLRNTSTVDRAIRPKRSHTFYQK